MALLWYVGHDFCQPWRCHICSPFILCKHYLMVQTLVLYYSYPVYHDIAHIALNSSDLFVLQLKFNAFHVTRESVLSSHADVTAVLHGGLPHLGLIRSVNDANLMFEVRMYIHILMYSNSIHYCSENVHLFILLFIYYGSVTGIIKCSLYTLWGVFYDHF